VVSCGLRVVTQTGKSLTLLKISRASGSSSRTARINVSNAVARSTVVPSGRTARRGKPHWSRWKPAKPAASTAVAHHRVGGGTH
jgi:hypothetical protein